MDQGPGAAPFPKCSARAAAGLAPGRAGRGIKRPGRIKRPPGLRVRAPRARVDGRGPVYAVELRAEHIIKARGALAPRGRAALCKGGGIEKGRRRGGAGRRRGALRPPRGAGACGGCGRAEEVRAARRAAGQRALVETGTNGEPASARGGRRGGVAGEEARGAAGARRVLRGHAGRRPRGRDRFKCSARGPRPRGGAVRHAPLRGAAHRARAPPHLAAAEAAPQGRQDPGGPARRRPASAAPRLRRRLVPLAPLATDHAVRGDGAVVLHRAFRDDGAVAGRALLHGVPPHGAVDLRWAVPTARGPAPRRAGRRLPRRADAGSGAPAGAPGRRPARRGRPPRRPPRRRPPARGRPAPRDP